MNCNNFIKTYYDRDLKRSVRSQINRINMRSRHSIKDSAEDLKDVKAEDVSKALSLGFLGVHPTGFQRNHGYQYSYNQGSYKFVLSWEGNGTLKTDKQSNSDEQSDEQNDQEQKVSGTVNLQIYNEDKLLDHYIILEGEPNNSSVLLSKLNPIISKFIKSELVKAHIKSTVNNATEAVKSSILLPALQMFMPAFGIATIPLNDVIDRVWAPMYKQLVELRNSPNVANLDHNSKEFKFGEEWANKARKLIGYPPYKGIQDSVINDADESTDEEIGKKAFNSMKNNSAGNYDQDNNQGTKQGTKNPKTEEPQAPKVAKIDKPIPSNKLPDLLKLFSDFLESASEESFNDTNSIKTLTIAFTICSPRVVNVEFYKWSKSFNGFNKGEMPDWHAYGTKADDMDRYFTDIILAINKKKNYDISVADFTEHRDEYRDAVHEAYQPKFDTWAKKYIKTLQKIAKEEQGEANENLRKHPKETDYDHQQKESYNRQAKENKTWNKENENINPQGEDNQQNSNEKDKDNSKESNDNQQNEQKSQAKNPQKRFKNLKEMRKARHEDSIDNPFPNSFSSCLDSFIVSNGQQLISDGLTVMNLSLLSQDEFNSFVKFADDFVSDVGHVSVDNTNRTLVEISLIRD